MYALSTMILYSLRKDFVQSVGGLSSELIMQRICALYVDGLSLTISVQSVDGKKESLQPSVKEVLRGKEMLRMTEETVVREGSIETLDLRLAAWLYLNNASLAKIIPVESSRCSFTFKMNSSKLEKLMEQWVNGCPTADVREVINAYLYLVHRGKDILRATRDIQ